MGFMANSGDSVLEMYLYETNTLLEQLDNIMLAAEQADTLSQDDVNEIFRIMHTLKGSAAMMEYEPLMTIAHRIEDLFYLIRENTMDIVPEQDRPKLFDLLFRSIDYFRDEIGKIERGNPFLQISTALLKQLTCLSTKLKMMDRLLGAVGKHPRRTKLRRRDAARLQWKTRRPAIRLRCGSFWMRAVGWRTCVRS